LLFYLLLPLSWSAIQMSQLSVIGSPGFATFTAIRVSSPIDSRPASDTIPNMGFNRRKMEDQRREAAEKEAANRRATDAQVLEDAERLIAAWNERQAKRMPMLFSPTIGAAVTAGYWFLWVRCPACRTINAIDLRTLDRVVPVLSAERAIY
jgi:hypothetical protein